MQLMPGGHVGCHRRCRSTPQTAVADDMPPPIHTPQAPHLPTFPGADPPSRSCLLQCHTAHIYLLCSSPVQSNPVFSLMTPQTHAASKAEDASVHRRSLTPTALALPSPSFAFTLVRPQYMYTT
ncbi:hypothetical protein COCSADRAFT_207261 [Bipolaris sorokiniana ND90Pr]|uniref:Uncharacterized protein n=1 Tax=Cochliobolus sativus (strain ND90Pr / ATCC 201652) TaxID=665912 RepID=M2SPP2_COCSN|nr:uncharacterized protein COCSADRAFT_207261 [Bipolaris sorokiniana ND90Pr]EMD69188.1 hypothetical protein COCSADRAFT_207261 [Bipolaris sorokiniana ND90Pr]